MFRISLQMILYIIVNYILYKGLGLNYALTDFKKSRLKVILKNIYIIPTLNYSFKINFI